MQKHIALLRGINVSGQKKIKMEELRACLSDVGFENVQTYIQSGNIAFESNSENLHELSAQIETVIKGAFGFEVPTIVVLQRDFERIQVSNPFMTADLGTKQLYVGFLFDTPEESSIEDLKNAYQGVDQYEIVGGFIFMCFHEGMGSSKMNNNFFERKLKVRVTTRNWNTIKKMASI